MTHVAVRAAEVADALYIAPRLRQHDREEVAAWGSPSLEAALLTPFLTRSPLLWTMCSDEEPVVLLGCDPVAGHALCGVPWAIGTDRIGKDWRSLLPLARCVVDAMHGIYPVLRNYVLEANTVHVRWLIHMGFSIVHRHARWGPYSLPFLKFVKVKPPCALPQSLQLLP